MQLAALRAVELTSEDRQGAPLRMTALAVEQVSDPRVSHEPVVAQPQDQSRGTGGCPELDDRRAVHGADGPSIFLTRTSRQARGFSRPSIAVHIHRQPIDEALHAGGVPRNERGPRGGGNRQPRS